MDVVNIGIIGCGGIANGKHMPNLAKLGNVDMVAFCDLIEERATKAASQYGVADADVFTDYHDLIALEDVDVVHVLTPNACHAPIASAALEAGKHVMCEKPMATTGEAARAMCAAARKANRQLSVGYQSRSRPESQYRSRSTWPGSPSGSRGP